MLIRFAVANHLSIDQRQELSLVASTTIKDSELNLIDSPVVPGGKLLPAAIIYGANASGKSNVISALSFLLSAVRRSHSSGEPGGGVPRLPFGLDPRDLKKPSSYEIDFVLGEIRYNYGFEATDSAFANEWLYSFPRGRRQCLFERSAPKRIVFGRSLKGRNRVIAGLMRSNSLFLSTAAQNGHEQLLQVRNYFDSITVQREVAFDDAKVNLALEGKIDIRIIKFLEDAGTGVVGFRTQDLESMTKDIGNTKKGRESELSREFDNLNKVLKLIMKKSGVGPQPEWMKRRVELAHKAINEDSVFFSLDRESAGTRRLLVILAGAFRALDEGAPFIVDELDASLHTQICEAIVALFSNKQINKNGAQMIATTHDTNLMRSPMLRRDQLWFTEKDRKGATKLFPLTDIRTRSTDNIEKGYLQGRYGAIPFAGSIEELTADL